MEKPYDLELMIEGKSLEQDPLSESKTEEKKKLKLFETFTKLWVSILLIVAMIDLQLSYFLAYLGREEIAETLSVAVVTEIIGVSAIYMIRAHFDTKSEEHLKFEKDKLAISIEDKENENDAVG